MSTITDYPKELYTYVGLVPGTAPAYQIELQDTETASALLVNMELSPGWDFISLPDVFRRIQPAAEIDEEKKKS